ncbi:cytochrome B6 [Archangium violaceum]|uniref:cytochrome B6 n=1 Tax=Archangium violaceum TaxID=83451 RepID=UPI00194DB40E|nr:cytochrome B6 [Archangium violaceum]QRN99068.1 cytochrome B6 [Archangium violaceum]
MKHLRRLIPATPVVITALWVAGCAALAQDTGKPRNKQPASGPDILKSEPSNTSEARPNASGKPLPDRDEVTRKQRQYLEQRYDLSGRTHPTLRMSGGRKAVPVGPTARLPQGVTWDALGQMSPEEMRQKKLFPYTPLWHPLQEVGGMVFPPVQTKVVDGLERVDVAFDLPDAYLPEFPPALFITTRPDLGDVSKGQLITLQNFETLFQDVLTPFQMEGMRLLLQKTTAQRHNLTLDRSTARPVEGVSCLDCHVNGHTTGQFHLTPDVRPQNERFRLDTASLRGLYAQTRFGSKRTLRSLEQFAQTEENSAYFDGDTSLAERKGARHFTDREQMAMGHIQNIIDFPPAPKLTVNGRLDRTQATEAEVRGEAVFDKHCASCHPAPFFTDNLTHDLRAERFYNHVGSTPQGARGRAEGPIKTFPLRGIKDSPPYLHDGRLLTLEDTVEFFNIVLQSRMTQKEKADLVEFLRVL